MADAETRALLRKKYRTLAAHVAAMPLRERRMVYNAMRAVARAGDSVVDVFLPFAGVTLGEFATFQLLNGGRR